MFLACIDSAGASGGESVVINPTLDVEKVIEPQPSNEFDNEPLSKWIEEMHVSSVIDGSSKLTCLLVCFLPSHSDWRYYNFCRIATCGHSDGAIH